ncbi:polysaccharide biosynthesis tyrosine autokinase [Mastigocoleus sp. MO_188.B34]|uniref:GumC family protein n=1 Tax=Mastigocoleus sp. MO_188.B34 TaxID=3036635 RepID=UPI00260F0938|nr:polysaccharide biosynthesis tyrosine autokinase [Mastigocoleus sp. MO_188.B34]MDJ0696410.1 polysaccharide biosynthesis tyrosine autokinase [Mastigocoleus sp. MO_188.B34]
MLVKEEDQDYIDLHKYWQILKRRWFLLSIVSFSVFGITGIITFLQQPIYEAQGKLNFNKQNGASSLTGLDKQLGELSGLTNTSNPLETEAEVIRSQNILKKTIAELKLRDRDNQTLLVDKFLQKLRVKSVRGTDVLRLSYQSTNPQEAAAVVNSIMKNYLEHNIRSNRAEATAAREFLLQQLPEVKAKVLEAEISLRKFKESNNIINLHEESKAGVESLKEISDEITKTQAQLVDIDTRSKALQNKLELNSQQAIALSGLSTSTGVQGVLEEYQSLQKQLATARTRYTDNHPDIIDLYNKILALREQLATQVFRNLQGSQSVKERDLQIGQVKQTLTSKLVNSEVERLGLANRVAQLRKEYAIFHQRLSSLPRLEQIQLQIERQLQIARSTYEQLLKRLQEVELLENQNVGNARILAEAVTPLKPVSPRIILNLLLGGFLSTILGMGIALLVEAMDKSIRSVEEAKLLLDYPLLGTVPTLDKKEKVDLPLLKIPYCASSYAFEMLQASLNFTTSDKSLGVIVVTSSVPGEGKSFVSSNLGIATAQLGKRVLIIDADMRCPRQHEIWSLHNLTGLSNILVGQTEREKTVRQKLYNLDILTSGTIPPNPIALLDSQRITSLIEQARSDYDFIIIDSPPSIIAPDAQLLGKLADGILFVVRPGTSDSSAVKNTKRILEQSGQHILGMVVNDINSGDSYGSHYAYQYYKQKVAKNNDSLKLPT